MPAAAQLVPAHFELLGRSEPLAFLLRGRAGGTGTGTGLPARRQSARVHTVGAAFQQQLQTCVGESPSRPPPPATAAPRAPRRTGSLAVGHSVALWQAVSCASCERHAVRALPQAEHAAGAPRGLGFAAPGSLRVSRRRGRMRLGDRKPMAPRWACAGFALVMPSRQIGAAAWRAAAARGVRPAAHARAAQHRGGVRGRVRWPCAVARHAPHPQPRPHPARAAGPRRPQLLAAGSAGRKDRLRLAPQLCPVRTALFPPARGGVRRCH